MLPVAERFVSINGEGPRAGEPACFIRFRGCDLKCSYCDTAWACRPDCPAEDMTPEALSLWVKNTGITNVTLTGGEPLLQTELPILIKLLTEACCRVEIETNGSLSLEALTDAPFRPVFTMDYKLPGSGMESFMRQENFSFLRSQDTVKFVSGDERDLLRTKEIIEKYALKGRCHLYISPVFGKIEPKEIAEFLIKNKMNDVRLQLQLHKFIWPPEMRGV